ncbi:TIGR03084 family metal-binding protein [Nocardia sp. BMG51109]|uniref:TIGR03084 family metal-binding protein n=1 Tax=Nocardia sp. BMG51109 TaxID=1056816 RepID=UPI000466CC15|nr:TIGR03084 family metal-binding protein [Nocardia sp. BMG51109]
MADLEALLGDFRAECTDLDSAVAPLDPTGWRRDTPAHGWTIAHQIGHLTWTDEIATLSATDPGAFAEVLREAMRPLPAASDTAHRASAHPDAARQETTTPDPSAFVDEAAERAAAAPAPELLDRWRRGRAALDDALRAVPAGTKLPWFGPPMSVASMVSARLMETWAHGQDVADALGIRRPPTARLRNIAHIGVRTRNFAYLVHGRTPPDEEFRIELTAPDGGTWAWGPKHAAQRITGPALDFCLLVTQRRHRDDVALTTSGPDTADWLTIAQAFAGPAGTGRAPGSFA